MIFPSSVNTAQVSIKKNVYIVNTDLSQSD